MKKICYLAVLAIALVACKGEGEDDKSLQLSPSSVNLFYEDAQQLKVLDASGTFEWSTANDFHATVNASGNVTAGHVGTTIISAKQGKKTGTCSVTVQPKYFLYDTPYFGWGSTMSQVKSKLGKPDQEQSEALVYVLSESKGIIALYMFENGKLYSVSVLVNVNYLATLTYYLVERYQPIDVEDDNYFFLDAMSFEKANMGLMLSYFKTNTMHGYYVIYMPIDHSQYAPTRRASYNEIKTPSIPVEFEHLFK